MAKNGVTLPKRKPGQRPGGGLLGGSASGTPQLPAGVSREKYLAAIKKCGGDFRGAFRGRHFKGFASSPAAKAALTKFATCMREHGVALPAPNTTGNGPVFDTKAIDTTSAKFREADGKCTPALRGAFPRSPGAGPGGGPPPGSEGT